jgi:hypothetical protein
LQRNKKHNTELVTKERGKFILGFNYPKENILLITGKFIKYQETVFKIILVKIWIFSFFDIYTKWSKRQSET